MSIYLRRVAIEVTIFSGMIANDTKPQTVFVRAKINVLVIFSIGCTIKRNKCELKTPILTVWNRTIMVYKYLNIC